MTALKRPHFLIIGAQKCGTSWLHHHLRQSESIHMPVDKDMEHFTYVGNLNEQAFALYCQRFADARADQLIGDANAGYFWTRTDSKWNRQPDSFNPAIPESVHRYCGTDLKLIIILRDPVERAISAYLHHVRDGAITLDHSILDTSLPLGIVDMGFYEHHLAQWRKFYPLEQFHIITAMPSTAPLAVKIMDQACAFLGASPIRPEQYYLEPIFPGLSRITNDDGVWLRQASVGDVVDLPKNAELIDVGEARYVKAISRQELIELKAIYGQTPSA